MTSHAAHPGADADQEPTLPQETPEQPPVRREVPQAPAALGGMGSTGPITIVPPRR
ncbi:hypothetical protein [Nesterenkonia sp.]|uniref:hypothetical protein n=1 Tax=Nesterenkonia sp. TaxID=704201 RepID=UPI0026119B6B|nr:hypothetical protein [Nesterenkonia sp.]